MFELSTDVLDAERLDAELLAVVADFKALGVAEVRVVFGFGCDPDALGREVPVAVEELVGFVADREADGTIELGDCNLVVLVGGLEFLFCHERDVHCSGEPSEALSAVRERWRRRYRNVWEREDDGPWRPLGDRPGDETDA